MAVAASSWCGECCGCTACPRAYSNSSSDGDDKDDAKARSSHGRAGARDRLSQMLSHAAAAAAHTSPPPPSQSPLTTSMPGQTGAHVDRDGATGTSDRNLFDGHFDGGTHTIDDGALDALQATLRASMTAEMREQIAALVQSTARSGGDGSLDAVRSAIATAAAAARGVGAVDGGGHGPRGMMGMMAFGVGENERGKKVARAASLAYDVGSGQVHKEFAEQQLEPDDVSLPRETVDTYDVADALEVEFVEDSGANDKKCGAATTTMETTTMRDADDDKSSDSSSSSSSDGTAAATTTTASDGATCAKK